MIAALCGGRLYADTPLSLADAQERALADNHLLIAAAAEVDGAAAAQLQSRSGYLPTVQFYSRVTRTNDAVSAFGLKLQQETFRQSDFELRSLNRPAAVTGYQTALEASQPLFSAGENLARRRAATAGVAAASAELERERQRVRLQTAEAYWGLVLARQALAVVDESLRAARAHARAAQARLDQERAPRTDLLAAQVRVARLEAEEIIAQSGIADVADALRLAMGSTDDGEEDLVPLDSLTWRPFEEPAKTLISQALLTRPDLLAAEHRKRAAREGASAARARQLPHVLGFARVQLDADEPFDRQGESWSVGATMSWSLFSGFENVAAVRSAKAGQARLQAIADRLRAEIDRDIRRFRRERRTAEAQLEVTSAAIAGSTERRRIAELRFGEGMAPVSELLDAEADHTAMQLARLQALYAYNTAMARLEFAVGRPLWEGGSP